MLTVMLQHIMVVTEGREPCWYKLASIRTVICSPVCFLATSERMTQAAAESTPCPVLQAPLSPCGRQGSGRRHSPEPRRLRCVPQPSPAAPEGPRPTLRVYTFPQHTLTRSPSAPLHHVAFR